jgi:uncharacterized protein
MLHLTRGWKVFLSIVCLIVLLIAGFVLAVFAYHHREERYNPFATSLAKPQTMPISCPNKRFLILSVDGGGVRGVIPLYYITQIEKMTGKPITQSFNLLAGISTGSIIVTTLALPGQDGQPRYSAKALSERYINDSKRIFSRPLKHQVLTLDGLIGPKYSNKGKHELFDHVYQNTRLNQLLAHVIVFGYDAVTKKVTPFCSWKGCATIGHRYPLKDIISGTTAVMGLFPSKIFLNEDQKLAHIINDVGLSINNPSLLAYLAAKKMCPDVKSYIIVSLGTGHFPGVDKASIEIEHWGALQWLPDILKTTSEDHLQISNEIMNLVMRHTRGNSKQTLTYIRINPALAPDAANPFDANPKDIKALIQTAKDFEQEKSADFKQIKQILTKATP